jgi:hypothetical protein
MVNVSSDQPPRWPSGDDILPALTIVGIVNHHGIRPKGISVTAQSWSGLRRLEADEATFFVVDGGATYQPSRGSE